MLKSRSLDVLYNLQQSSSSPVLGLAAASAFDGNLGLENDLGGMLRQRRVISTVGSIVEENASELSYGSSTPSSKASSRHNTPTRLRPPPVSTTSPRPMQPPSYTRRAPASRFSSKFCLPSALIKSPTRPPKRLSPAHTVVLLLYLTVLLTLTLHTTSFLLTHYDRPPPRKRHRRLRGKKGSSNWTPSSYISEKADTAIAITTTALSPYLPFAGGMDVRRILSFGLYDARERGVKTKSEEVFREIVGNFRGGEQTPSSQTSSVQPYNPISKGGKAVKLVLGSSNVRDIFEYIEGGGGGRDEGVFNLLELADAFKYAWEGGSADSSSHITPLFSTLITSSLATFPPTLSPTPDGTPDALLFCSVMRAFADWRLVKQTPPGYKGYSVGMELGRKDVVQNIAKVERAVHEYIRLHSHRPTVLSLLKNEIPYHSPSRLPKLRDPSAAIGMLWMWRQLKYQWCIYEKFAKEKMGVEEGVGNAYDEVYGPLHGWIVRKIFQTSFKAAPDPDVIFKVMVGKEVEERLKNSKGVGEGGNSTRGGGKEKEEEKVKENENEKEVEIEAVEKDKPKPLENFGDKWVHFWDGVGKNIQRGLDDVGKNVGKIFDKNNKDDGSSTEPEDEEDGDEDEGEDGAGGMDEERKIMLRKDIAMEQMMYFLDTLEPIVNKLEELFNDLNMNDPTVV